MRSTRDAQRLLLGYIPLMTSRSSTLIVILLFRSVEPFHLLICHFGHPLLPLREGVEVCKLLTMFLDRGHRLIQGFGIGEIQQVVPAIASNARTSEICPSPLVI